MGQLHNAVDLLQHLEDSSASSYSEEVRASTWFEDFVRYLRHLVKAISPKGVQRGHLVDTLPGSLLQEFYTTDGSGTAVAQDVYQGLGRATLGDAGRIHGLLTEDNANQMQPSHCLELSEVQAGCLAGEFFAWKRDEVVLGCGQLVALMVPPPARVTEVDAMAEGTSAPSASPLGLVAELRCFAVTEGLFATYAPALLGYAERAALEGGAALLAVPAVSFDAELEAWFAARGFRAPTEREQASLQPHRGDFFLKPLGSAEAEEVERCFAAFAEEQRMWGNVVAP